MTHTSFFRTAVAAMSLAVLMASAPAGVQAARLSADDAVTVQHGFATFELARRGRGADDAPGDDRRGRGRGADDGANHTWNTSLPLYELARRGRGADDAPGDDRRGRGRGADDGANHG